MTHEQFVLAYEIGAVVGGLVMALGVVALAGRALVLLVRHRRAQFRLVRRYLPTAVRPYFRVAAGGCCLWATSTVALSFLGVRP